MKTRACKKCSATKIIEEFPLYDRANGKRRHECGACNKQRVEAHHQANKAKRLRKARERYYADPIAVWPLERKERAKGLANARNAKLRDEVFHRHGGECQACGENEQRFLTIDHVNNDGWSKRAESSRESGTGLYRDILRHGMRHDLEILCFNCNFGKRRNGGILVLDRRLKGRSNGHPERE